MDDQKNQTKAHFKAKFQLIFWAMLLGFFGGVVAVFLLALVSFVSALLFLDSVGIGLGIFLFIPVFIVGALVSSHKFLSSKGIAKSTRNKNYSVLIGVIILTFAIHFSLNFSMKHDIRPRYSSFAKALSEGDYSKAYSLMSPAYREQHSTFVGSFH